MLEFTARVIFVTSKNCFCYLPDIYSRFAQQGDTVKVRKRTENPVYLSIGGFFSQKHSNDVVGLNPLYAKALELNENDTVIVEQCSNPPVITRLSVSPLNQNDYEILDVVSTAVEDTLLRQIRVVTVGQRFVIWVSNYSTITVRADSAEPVTMGLLDVLTEISVQFPAIKNKNMKNEKSTPDLNSGTNIFRTYANDDGDSCKIVLNLVPFPNACQPFDAFTQTVKKCKIYRLIVLGSPKPLKEAKEIFLRVQPLKEHDILNSNYFENPLFMNKSIFDRYFGTKGTKVQLSSIQHAPTSHIKIFSKTLDNKRAEKNFAEFVAKKIADEDELLMCSGIIFETDQNEPCYLEMDSEFCVLNKDSVNSIQITAEFVNHLGNKTTKLKNKPGNLFWEEGNVKCLLQELCKCLRMNAVSRQVENVLLIGQSGSGKTSTLNNLLEKFQSNDPFMYFETLSCKKLKGKSNDSLLKQFSPIITKLIYYQPSALILDDLHVICEKVAESDVPTQEGLYFNGVSEMIANIIENDFVRNNITVVASSGTLELNSKLFTMRGKHLFKHVYEIDELSQTDRTSLIDFLFRSKKTILQNVDAQSFAVKTEGFVMRDIVDFVDRALFESYKEDRQHVTNEDCQSALRYVNEMCLQNVNLHSPGDRTFDDIGGLEDVKRVLVESLLWPLQYSRLFSEAPLRLQSGLLLYGPPGTGKTILAAAAAKQCGVRLISVKGPELLSKYIGASEQAVRDIFEKAQKAKPCIIFFDEFDSLAPRRGHDNTGVTDRVVNQFLTQLDGVEALVGVCVLAATSRPDLLDPALLRPGRLDNQILCPLPDERARLEILKILTKKINLCDDVDLAAIAAKTDGFSGADLQAVICSAQLLLAEALDVEGWGNKKIEIRQMHLKEALETTRPSLTLLEQEKYAAIYSKFSSGANIQDFKTGKVKLKATLA